MSSIDKYKHKMLGLIECPSSYDFVYDSPTRSIAVYEILEDIPADERDFDGVAGDILVGGGSGESPALRISMPDALNFFISNERVNINSYDNLLNVFWSPTQSFKLCEGFQKLGWNPDQPIEFWVAENICRTLVNEVKKFAELNSGIKLSTPLKWTVC